MKELFGLKDENGKEYKLVLEDESVYAEPIQPESEFKAGQWVVGIWDNCPITPGYIIKINDNGNAQINNFDDYHCMDVYIKGCVRLATEEEIKVHLRKIADEKYIGKSVKCLKEKDYIYPHLKIQTPRKFLDYMLISDELRYEDNKDFWICIYKQGKWAEMVPGKKKLPKTKEEFDEFLNLYMESEDETDQSFLDEYED